MPSLTLSVHSPSPFDSTRSLVRPAGEAATGRPAGGRLRAPTAARPGGGVETAADADLLLASFPPYHLGAYLEAARGNRRLALRLYLWNSEVSAAFYAPLQELELALRHAFRRELTARYGEAWYDNEAAGLDARSRARVAAAKLAAAPAGQTVAPPARVVEKLAFGFWTSLVSRGGRLDESSSSDRRADYARTLWAPALRAAFPHRTWLTRRQAQSALDRLRRLRNAVAHHEPIFERPLWGDYQHILTVAGWISSEARVWIERRRRVPGLLRTGIRASEVELHWTKAQAA